MFGNPLHHWCQRGAIIVFTAFLLPLLMACTGLAVDLGNLYVHKARLQNAADAAALAGAREFAVKGETVDAHPEADVEADLYVDADAQNRNLPNAITGRLYRAKEVDDAIYYRVDLTENVPLYFLRIFGLMDSDVSAASVAAIGMVGESGGGESGGSESPGDVFIFRKNFDNVNVVRSNDANNKDNIITTFDGKVAFTDGSGKNPNRTVQNVERDKDYTLQYYAQQVNSLENPLECFFTSKAREDKLSVNEAMNKKDASYAHEAEFVDYDMEKLGQIVYDRLEGLQEKEPVAPTQPEQPKDGNWDAYNKAIVTYQREYAAYQDAVAAYNRDVNSVSASAFATDQIWNNRGGQNITINIDGTIPGDANDPVYCYLGENFGQVKLNVNASNNRPLILVYMGSGKLQMDMSAGNTFRGIVYAPHVNKEEGLLLNANYGTFRGTIIANAVSTRQGGTYIYEDFGIEGTQGTSGAGSGSSGKKTVKSTSNVQLVSGNAVSWD